MRAGEEGAHERASKQSLDPISRLECAGMKRLVFIALLVLSSGPAYAELVAVAQSANDATIYIDSETISRNGYMV